MKNVTIALDDEVHRQARIRAAELGTSLSALVKDYLVGLAGGQVPSAAGVREMTMPFKHAEPAADGPPWLVDGIWVYTMDGKPRQPGGLRGKFKPVSREDLETPDWLIEIMEHWDESDFDPLP